MKSKAAILAALFAFAAFANATIGGFADTPALQNYGSLTSTGSVGVRNLTNQSTCTTTVSGGATKTITFEGEGNGPSTGSSYIALPDTGTYSALNTTTFQGSTPATTATADGLYVTPVAGLTGFRARVSSYSSGTVNITVFCTGGVLASTSAGGGGGGGGTYTAPPVQAVTLPSSFQTAFPTPAPFPSVQPVSLPSSFQSSFPTPPPTQPVSIASPLLAPYAATTGQAAIANSFFGSACVAVSALPTLTSGQVSPCLTDLSGNQYVNVGTPTVNAGTGFPSPIAYTAASPLPVTTAAPATYPFTMATGSPQPGTAGSAIGVAGMYNSISPSLANGQVLPFQMTGNGFVKTTTCSNTAALCTTFASPADALANTQTNPIGENLAAIFNGSTWDRAPYCSGAPLAINITTATTTQLVALSGTTKIHVCSYQFSVAGTSPTVTFEYGTGTNCATGLTAISGAIAPTSGSVVNSASGGTAGLAFVVPAGDALCLLSGGTTPSIQGILTYSQY